METHEILSQSREASRKLLQLNDTQINNMLIDLAHTIIQHTPQILEANQLDLDRMEPSNPKYDRLKLTQQRISDIATDMQNVAQLPSPLNKIIEQTTRPNGLQLTKKTVPFGVIGIIYEARPNVTYDVFSLCIKSGNACVLKGGTDAQYTNQYSVELIKQILQKHNITQAAISLLSTHRKATEQLLNANEYVDLIIPRGSQQLIDFVRYTSTVPVIETGAGICHTYFHTSGNVQHGAQIINNAKTRRPSVCNSLDTLIIDHNSLNHLPQLCQPLAQSNVTIYADTNAYKALEGHYKHLQHADQSHFGTEFLDYKMAIKTVDNINQALDHINTYSSKHSESIIAQDPQIIEQFQLCVDAAAVYTNTSTAFTDGAQFGLGAEIGISTQKLHARGPMALAELTSYKWLINSNGQTRP